MLIPSEPSFQVEAWVFERSPAELKRAFQDAQRKRDQGQASLPSLLARGFSLEIVEGKGYVGS